MGGWWSRSSDSDPSVGLGGGGGRRRRPGSGDSFGVELGSGGGGGGGGGGNNTSSSLYRYPPKSGNYFGSHFIMGGEKFETPQPEQYLFGDNADLNFLGGKPVPFPYPAPQSNEPTKTLKALVNIRKETLKLVKIGVDKLEYNVEFVFDSDCRCEITIFYSCVEEVTQNGLMYRPRDPKLTSEPIKFKSGPGQVYTNSQHIFRPGDFAEGDLQFDWEKEVFPVVIQVVATEGDEPKQSHATTATVDKYSDGSYGLKPLKQKLFVDGLVYLLQEIYGIENKANTGNGKVDDDEEGENAAECVICMSDSRDTLILPCRHLCLCHACADSLRYQANNCPICRAPFRALLQIRAVYRIPPAPIDYTAGLSPDMPVIHMNAIPGYEMVPLLEALNGPYQPSDLTMAAASVAREAARTLNSTDDSAIGGNTGPIAMTVMTVATNKKPLASPDEEEEDEHNRQCEQGKRNSTKLSTSSSLQGGDGAPTSKTPIGSDPEEDDIHFCEEADEEALPDLKEFTSSTTTSPIPEKEKDKPASLSRQSKDKESSHSQHHLHRNSVGSGSNLFVPRQRKSLPSKEEEEEDDIRLESVEGSPIHSTNVLMIAAIDEEFSDEEDTTRTSRNRQSQKSTSTSSRLHLEGSRTGFGGLSESAQSTPYRATKSASSAPPAPFSTSLPTTPNPRAHSASTRSSGESFTSSSSTKQLLPNTSLHHI